MTREGKNIAGVVDHKFARVRDRDEEAGSGVLETARADDGMKRESGASRATRLREEDARREWPQVRDRGSSQQTT